MTKKISFMTPRELELYRADQVRNKASYDRAKRVYSIKNKEKCSAAKTKWRKDNPEKMEEARVRWASVNGERIAAKRATHFEVNKKRIYATNAAWREANRDRFNKMVSDWSKANPEKLRTYVQNRRSWKLSTPGRISPDIAKRLLSAQKGKCACCEKKVGKKYHLDHIFALASGGEHSDRNIQILCPRCNLTKGKKHPVDFMQSRGFLL